MIKKIETKEQKSKKEKKNQLVLAGLLIFVMLFSIFGIIFQYMGGFGGGTNSQNPTVTYKGLTFQEINGYYVLQSGSSSFYFSTDPQTAGNSTSEIMTNKTLSSYAGQVVYVSSPYDYNAYNDIYTDLSNYTRRVQGACAVNETCVDSTLPLKDCSSNLIIIKKAQNNQIYQKGNCIYIEGKQSDLLGLTDEFLMHILGIN
jgi:hypothetical protein